MLYRYGAVKIICQYPISYLHVLKFSCTYLVYRLMFAIVCYYDARLVLILMIVSGQFPIVTEMSLNSC